MRFEAVDGSSWYPHGSAPNKEEKSNVAFCCAKETTFPAFLGGVGGAIPFGTAKGFDFPEADALGAGTFPEPDAAGAGVVGGPDAVAASLVTTVFGRPFGFGFGDFGVVVVVVVVFPL